MASFRLKMATQLGEKKSEEFGFIDFPIDVHAIAKANGINIIAKPNNLEGVSGAIILANNMATIIYSTEYNEGFENFSIAHELGHWFLPGHPEEILKTGGHHISHGNFINNTSIELEADHFASGLLLPSLLTRKLLLNNQIGLEGIINLARKAHCSITAAAIRAAECSICPIAIIVSKDNKIFYAFMSESFKNLGKLAYLRKGTSLPQSETQKFNLNKNNVLEAKRVISETDLSIWFGGSSKIILDEEIIGLGNYGYTLTVLSSDYISEYSCDEEAEEAEIEESWTPHFAYGR